MEDSFELSKIFTPENTDGYILKFLEEVPKPSAPLGGALDLSYRSWFQRKVKQEHEQRSARPGNYWKHLQNDFFGYAWLSDQAFDTIQKYAQDLNLKLIEIGAGSGMTAFILKHYLGCDIIAYDPKNPAHDYKDHWDRLPSNKKVKIGDQSVIKRHPDRVLLLCWPPFIDDNPIEMRMQIAQVSQTRLTPGSDQSDNFVPKLLKDYTQDLIFYVGEAKRGCTGSKGMFESFEQDWIIQEKVVVKGIESTMQDSLYVLRRRKPTESSQQFEVYQLYLSHIGINMLPISFQTILTFIPINEPRLDAYFKSEKITLQTIADLLSRDITPEDNVSIMGILYGIKNDLLPMEGDVYILLGKIWTLFQTNREILIPKSETPDADYCSSCQQIFPKKLKTCARCKQVYYCSVECQRKDWKLHKKDCRLRIAKP